jgi:hypothetical protein
LSKAGPTGFSYAAVRINLLIGKLIRTADGAKLYLMIIPLMYIF